MAIQTTVITLFTTHCAVVFGALCGCFSCSNIAGLSSPWFCRRICSRSRFVIFDHAYMNRRLISP